MAWRISWWLRRRYAWRVRLRNVGLSCCWVLAAIHGPLGAAETARESSVKAAYLYKFPTYVMWSGRPQPSISEPLVIGVSANSAVMAALQEIAASREPGEQPIRVQAVQNAESLQSLHVLFIGRDAQRDQERLLAAAGDRSVLTVTEMERVQDQPSVINFVLIDGRVRFTISMPAAERAGLRLSSRLLAVAHDVIKEGR